ncbi:MAG: LarC family nickel insertion protein, partial [Planctomycetia bacterium]|nr:LarC family nickel insertion protein [Planctomycetia bacterium]
EHDHEHDHEHEHCHAHRFGHGHSHSHGRTFQTIRALLEASELPLRVKETSIRAFELLAQAEAEVHGKPIDEVHFHEVGAVDSIVDMVGSILALDSLGIDGISLSPLPVGEGTFKCAHGIYPLPAPATAVLMRNHNLPVSLDVERCEMLTPTAAALFATWTRVEIPRGSSIVTTVNSFGTREMANRPNLLRATIYATPESVASMDSPYEEEEIVELQCNIDDATGERISTVTEALFESGVRDAWVEPIQMKKGRPAVKLCTLTTCDTKNRALAILFQCAGSFGVRQSVKRRYVLARHWQSVPTRFGEVRIKIGADQTGKVLVSTPEFQDCNALAREHGVTFDEVYRAALHAYDAFAQR